MTEQHAPIENAPAPGTTSERIMLNLDTLENDAKREPFAFVHAGRRIVLADPGDLDWQAIDALEDEREFLTLAMSPEDHEFFLANSMPLWKMDKLGKAYQEHYKMGDPGKAA